MWSIVRRSSCSAVSAFAQSPARRWIRATSVAYAAGVGHSSVHPSFNEASASATRLRTASENARAR